MLEALAQIFAITTGVIFALAALFAFMVQRARYLREIEPDLVLTSPRPTYRMGSWTLSFDAENRSNNTAENIEVSLATLFGKDGEAKHDPSSPFGSRSPLLARRKRVIEVMFAEQPDLEPGMNDSLSCDLSLKYTTVKEWLILALNPFGGFRRRYFRSFDVTWCIEMDEDEYSITNIREDVDISI